MNKYSFYIPILTFLIFFTSCEKSLEFPLAGDQIDKEIALNTPENLIGLLNSTYDVFANTMNGSVQNLNELLSDNLSTPPTDAGSLYFTIYNRGTFSFRTAGGVLTDLYRIIYRSNLLIENVDRFESLDKTRMIAEAKFLRGWAHWEIAKLWAQPYGYTPDNSHLGIAIKNSSSYSVELRAKLSEVYTFILKDISEAYNELPDQNGFYADKMAANALLAKIYFQMNDYVNAYKFADVIISSQKYQLSQDYQRFIGDQGSETIFKTVSTSLPDNRGILFGANYRSDNNPNPQLKPSKELVLLFDENDQRSSWVEIVNKDMPTEFYVSHKFDKDFFSVPLLHYSDMLLIRAECAMRNGGGSISGAADDLNEILERAYGNPDNNVSSTTITLAKIREERRKEMCFEGDRVSDLKRRGAGGENIVIRNAPWNCPGMVLQYPATENTIGFEFNQEGGCN